MRIVWVVLLLAVAAFAAFGFLASFEGGVGLGWRVGYGALCAGSLASAGLVAFKRGRRRTAA